MARQAHLSPSQCTRRFRALTGQTPNRFVIAARLERARLLLRGTDMTLAQIASAPGYADGFFFSRQYKAFVGHVPGRERRGEM